MDRVPPGKRAQSLPMVLALTTLVLVVPCLAAFGLQSARIVSSPVLLVLLPVLLSILVSHFVSEVWKRRRAGSPYLFDDLMLWGWIRQRRFERLLSEYEDLIGPDSGQGSPPDLKAKELERLAGAMEARDPRTHGHSRRVSRHATSIARSLKLAPDEIARIRTAALLHDIGKIETPWSILEKPGGLTEEEFQVIKEHPVAGARLVEGLGDPELVAIVRHHHERIDGGGYPDGLEGEEVPLGARVVAVADTFDALTSARSYRQPRSHEEALEVLRSEAGSQLDARAVAAFDGRYSGRRPVALAATLLGLGRQAGQSIISFGTGASQVAAVGAAAVVIGAAPAVEKNIRQEPQKPPVQNQVASGTQGETESAGSALSVPSSSANGSPSAERVRTGKDSARSDQRVRAGAEPGVDQDAGPDGSDGENPESSGGSGAVDGNPGESGSSTGGGSGGSNGGGTSAGGGGGSQTVTQPVKKITETVTKPVQQITEQVTDSVPTLPGNDPVSQGVNNTVSGVKDTVGKLIGKP